MEDFLKFRKMITPAIIQIVFWIGVVMSVLGGLGMMISSFYAYSEGGALFFSGLMMIILGPIGVRIWCEVVIVFFRMNENLTDIRDALAKK
jgi:hypothetical protein